MSGISLLGAGIGAAFLAFALFNHGRRQNSEGIETRNPLKPWHPMGLDHIEADEKHLKSTAICLYSFCSPYATWTARIKGALWLQYKPSLSSRIMMKSSHFSWDFSFELWEISLFALSLYLCHECSRNASFPHTQWELNQDTPMGGVEWLQFLQWCQMEDDWSVEHFSTVSTKLLLVWSCVALSFTRRLTLFLMVACLFWNVFLALMHIVFSGSAY